MASITISSSTKTCFQVAFFVKIKILESLKNFLRDFHLLTGDYLPVVGITMALDGGTP